MPERGLKQMAADRDLKVGHFIVEFATPGIGQIIKAAGCDFALLDTEHSGFGYETMKSVLRYTQAASPLSAPVIVYGTILMSRWTTSSLKRRPISRLTANKVLVGFVTAWRLAD